ncbi:MAG TPA: 2OG-Fe(II) oxygenase [Burkholderiales bacterium]|nr:2OG-Fe(II) oxygenase [Burkholderiales bacterium]
MQVAAPQIVRHRVLHLDGFLAPGDVTALMDYTFASQAAFVQSGTSDSAANYRKSLVLNPSAAVSGPFTAKIRAIIPQVITGLRMRPFECGTIECQITANTDGSFFNIHTDAGHNETILRQLTYVYYFNREPKGFDGGELRIYDDQIRNGKLARIDSYQTVEPRQNSIVFFQAPIMHEVALVRVASGDFRDSRFTVNGWVNRAA